MDTPDDTREPGVLSCSLDSKRFAIFEGLDDSDLKTGTEIALIQTKFRRIEEHLLQEKPAQAIRLLIEVLDDLNAFSERDEYSLWEKLYLYFSKAYEQAEDWKSVTHCLDMTIRSVECRLSRTNSESSTGSATETKMLLAELRKRYAIALEGLNEDAKGVAFAWIEVEKAFKDCDSNRDACFSALRAVRWYITAKDLDSALSALSIALGMVKFVEEMSDRGILYNELGIAFLAFELRDDSIACFRKSLKNLSEEDSEARASVLQNLGSAYIAAKKFTKAITKLEQSVAAYGATGNRAGRAHAHCNLGYAFMCAGRHKLSHWHYTLARDLAKETAWETVQIQAEEALDVLETPNFSHNATGCSPTISICPSMARLQCRTDSKTSSSSSPSVRSKKKKGRRRVIEDKEKHKIEQLKPMLNTSSLSTKSSHPEEDIYLPTGQTRSLYKMDAVQPTSDRSSPRVITPVEDTKTFFKTLSAYLKTAPPGRKPIRRVMNRKKFIRIYDISSLKPLGNPNSFGDQSKDTMFKPVTTATLSRLRRAPITMPSK